MFCDTCKKKDGCKKLCDKMKAVLYAENPQMERHYQDNIVSYPMNNELRFSEMPEGMPDEFSEDDVPDFSSGDKQLKQTKIFIERFFNRRSIAELAAEYEVTDNDVIKMYMNSARLLSKAIDFLDARRAGVNMMSKSVFNEEQRYFLLHSCFGYTKKEISEIYKKNETVVGMKISRMVDKYRDKFESKKIEITEPEVKAKMSRADVIKAVDEYETIGISAREAFKKIAERQGEITGAPVKMRSVESKYYKAMRASGGSGTGSGS